MDFDLRLHSPYFLEPISLGYSSLGVYGFEVNIPLVDDDRQDQDLHHVAPIDRRDNAKHQLVNVVVSPQSAFIGRKVAEFPLRDNPLEVSLVARCRNEQPIAGRMEDVRVEVGDLAVLEVDESFFYVNAELSEFSLVRRLRGYRIPHRKH